MINQKKLSLIHVAVNKLKLTDQEYREILKDNFNKKSSKQLCDLEFTQLMKIFKLMGFETIKSDRITPAQRALIYKYCERLGWIEKERLYGFIKRQIGKDAVTNWLTVEEAQKVIEGLKSIYYRKDKK